MRLIAAIVCAGVFSHLLSAGEVSTARLKGRAIFKPRGDQQEIPAKYRLDAHEFDWQMNFVRELPENGVEIFEVTFPSPVKTPHEENNTVWAEYYRPKGKKDIPCVIVLDITGGDQTLSRVIARHFAQNEVGGLFVQMAYYGPRRPPGSNLRLLSYDIDQTFKAITQTVLDLRRATAFMEARPEVDKKRLGIMGTSLGSFMAALTAQTEPKLGRLAVLLGGGDFVDGFWDHPQAKPVREIYETVGGTKKQAKAFIADIDPITRAHLLKDRKVLIIGAKNDEIVPPRMTENLWRATGEQQIIWLNSGHYSAAVYLLPGLGHVVRHFKAD